MSESMITTEANNVTPPLKNSTAMKCIAVLVYGGATQTQDLTALFGRLDSGHYLTLQADGGKVYVAFGTVAGTIDEGALGNSNNACFPIADGGQLSVRSGQYGDERATGIATMVNYNILHFKGVSGAATGFLRMYRSSLNSNEDAGMFRAP